MPAPYLDADTIGEQRAEPPALVGPRAFRRLWLVLAVTLACLVALVAVASGAAWR
jgi:hypothetical protein